MKRTCNTGYTTVIKGFINDLHLSINVVLFKIALGIFFLKSMQPVPRFKLILTIKKRIDIDILYQVM